MGWTVDQMKSMNNTQMCRAEFLPNLSIQVALDKTATTIQTVNINVRIYKIPMLR